LYWNDEARLVFLAHPRTASRSIANALRLQCGFKSGGNHHAAPIGKDDYTKFTVVRNHFDTLVSWWFFIMSERKHDPKPFDKDFIPYLWNYSRYGYGKLFPIEHRLWGLHSAAADYVLHYETLLADLNGVLTTKGLGVESLTHVHDRSRNGTPYEPMYDTATRRFVEDWFAEELEELDYSYD